MHVPPAPVIASVAAALTGSLLAACDGASSLATRAGIGGSFEARCEKALPPTRVDVVTIPVHWNTDRTRSVRELTRMSGDNGDVNRALGLTTAEIGHKAFLETAGLDDTRNGRICIRPTIRVELAMTPMTVYVSREFAGDTCREPAIVEHEIKHVTVYANYLSAVADDVRKSLRAEYGNKVFQFRDRAEARREMEGRLGDRLRALLTDNAQRVKALQRAVDSPEEYARVAGACGGMRVD
jgi:hypothetical protein